LPSTALAAFFGPLNLLLVNRDFRQVDLLVNKYLPHIIQQAQNSEFFMNIYFEKEFEKDCDEIRYLMKVKPLIK